MGGAPSPNRGFRTSTVYIPFSADEGERPALPKGACAAGGKGSRRTLAALCLATPLMQEDPGGFHLS